MNTRKRTHGLRSTYVFGCRCDKCRASVPYKELPSEARVDLAKLRAKHQADTKEHAYRSGSPWENWEAEVAMDYTKSAYEVALEIHRTYRAVLLYRYKHKLRRDWYNLANMDARSEDAE